MDEGKLLEVKFPGAFASGCRFSVALVELREASFWNSDACDGVGLREF